MMRFSKTIQQLIRPIIRRTGFDVVRYFAIAKLLESKGINLVLDVGANEGQYSVELRQSGYRGRIVSFEPVKKVYDLLQVHTAKDSLWDSVNFALGNYDGQAMINIAANQGASSSILEMLPSHIKSAPDAIYIGSEEVILRQLDTVFGDYVGTNDKILLKIDVQGFEKNVLDGAKDSLCRIYGIQIEMSLVPLYKDALIMPDILSFLSEHGFQLSHIAPVFSDPNTGQLLQCDGLFFRT